MIWSCCFWCLIFFGNVKRERIYDTHMKTWVVVWLKTVRQWKKQSSTEKRKKPKTSELIVDKPNTFFLVTVTQLVFDSWGFKGSNPPQMLRFSVHWQQPRAFPGKCQLAGYLCVVQVYWRALLLRMLSCLSRIISWTESSASILALFLKPEQTVFLFVIMAIIFFFIAKSNLKNASVLPARSYTLRNRDQLHKRQGKLCFKSSCDQG